MRWPFVLVLLSLPACWNGDEALHKRCDNNDHCGRKQECVTGFCDGPPACNPPEPSPMVCDYGARVTRRELRASVLPGNNFAAANVATAGEFAGDDRTDLAVLTFSNGLFVMENAGAMWPENSYQDFAGGDLVDMIATDLDDDDVTEFVVLARTGFVYVVHWDGETFTTGATIDFSMVEGASTTPASFAVTDLVGNPLPDLFAVGTGAATVVPNVGGMFSAEMATVREGAFLDPHDTLVVGEGPGLRLLVTESDEAAADGVMNKRVDVLRIADDELLPAVELTTELANPWALAEGDFLGGDELEIAVAERRLTLGSDNGTVGTTNPGRIHFYRLVGDAVTEVGAPLEVGVGPQSLAAADLDCDGKSDLVIGNSGAPESTGAPAQIFFGSCDTSATTANLMTVPRVDNREILAGARIGFGDFDDDGLLEVAIPDIIEAGGTMGGRVVIVDVQEAE